MSVAVVVLYYLQFIQLKCKVLYLLMQKLSLDYLYQKFRVRLISRLIKGISKVLQKLFKFFNSIFAFIILALLVLLKNFDSDSDIMACGSSLQNCYKLPNVFE